MSRTAMKMELPTENSLIQGLGLSPSSRPPSQRQPSLWGKSFLVLDEFLENPNQLRQSALDSGFGSWRPRKGEVGSSIYDGMNFWGDHAMALRALSAAHGRAIFPNSMFFRVTNTDTEAAYVHSDREMGDFTCILYLSQHDADESGTGFYRHRESGMTRMPSFEEMRKRPEWFENFKAEMVAGNPEAWQLTRFVQGYFNRALIFEAPLFHSRLPKFGYGSNAIDGRMVWVCHYSLGER